MDCSRPAPTMVPLRASATNSCSALSELRRPGALGERATERPLPPPIERGRERMEVRSLSKVLPPAMQMAAAAMPQPEAAQQELTRCQRLAAQTVERMPMRPHRSRDLRSLPELRRTHGWHPATDRNLRWVRLPWRVATLQRRSESNRSHFVRGQWAQTPTRRRSRSSRRRDGGRAG